MSKRWAKTSELQFTPENLHFLFFSSCHWCGTVVFSADGCIILIENVGEAAVNERSVVAGTQLSDGQWQQERRRLRRLKIASGSQ